MKHILVILGLTVLLFPVGAVAQNTEDSGTLDITFYQIYAFAAYEGLEPSTFPGTEGEPTFLVSHRQIDRADDVAKWLQELFGFESVDVLDVQTVVQVSGGGVHRAQPTFFNVGATSEFRVWWLGDSSEPISDFVTVSLCVDLEEEDFIPQMQLVCDRGNLVVIGKRCSLAEEEGLLESLEDFSYEPTQIFLLTITPIIEPISEGEDYKRVVENYMRLRGQQKAKAGTIPLIEDRGYLLIEDLFKQTFDVTDFGFAKNKRLPISSKSRPVLTESYDIPPQPAKGMESVRDALARVFDPEQLRGLSSMSVSVLINEKGRVEALDVKGTVDEHVKNDLFKAMKLVRWNPALREDKPVKVWTVLAVPDFSKQD